MTSEEFATRQKNDARMMLSTLVGHCVRRYYTAADLVGLQGPIIDRIGEERYAGGVDVAPLLPVWDVICSRYREERFDAQAGLFESHEAETVKLWGQFVYYHLFPRLVQENECVRNVLRIVRLLPCQSAEGAVSALRSYIIEMPLPDARPPRDTADIEGL